MACPPADLSPDHRYHSLFDAAAAVGVDLVLDERFHPGAVEALCEWAARKNKSLGHRDCPPWTGVLYVRIPVAGTPDGRVFEVFQRGENRR
jgi:hypothetical protein